jgi:hypothetical protein
VELERNPDWTEIYEESLRPGPSPTADVSEKLAARAQYPITRAAAQRWLESTTGGQYRSNKKRADRLARARKGRDSANNAGDVLGYRDNV